MVDCNDITEEFKNYLIDATSEIGYYKDKAQINLFHDYTCSSDIKSRVLDVYSNDKNIKISICLKSERFLHELALKSKKNCHLVISDNFDFT
jgi:hypothetical protein